MSFGLLVRGNPIDVDRWIVVVDDNSSRFDDLAQCFSVGALNWKRNGLFGVQKFERLQLVMRKTSTASLACECRTGRHVLDIGVFKKDCFSLSDLLTLSGVEIKP
jgi:hypothetical protein